MVFQYIAMLRKNGPKKFFYDEVVSSLSLTATFTLSLAPSLFPLTVSSDFAFFNVYSRERGEREGVEIWRRWRKMEANMNGGGVGDAGVGIIEIREWREW